MLRRGKMQGVVDLGDAWEVGDDVLEIQSNCLKFVQSGTKSEDHFWDKDEIFIEDVVEVELTPANLKKNIKCEFHHFD